MISCSWWNFLVFLISWRRGCLLEMGGSWNPFLEPIQSVSWGCTAFKVLRATVMLSLEFFLHQAWFVNTFDTYLSASCTWISSPFRHLQNLIRSSWQLTWNLAILSFRVVRTPISPGVCIGFEGLKSHHILSLEFSYSTTFCIRLDLPNTFDIWKFAFGFHCFLKAAKPNQKFLASYRKSGNLILKGFAYIVFESF